MSNPNLKSVIAQLKSDKLKERQQGLISLRQVFSRDHALENLDPEGDGKAWLVVFQALFTAVLNERSAAIKKGASVAAGERRLKDAATTVRWLTERSVTRWPMKVAKPLVRHLLQTMVRGGQLDPPVALDYVKALRVICDYTPHRDHIMTGIDHWVPLLSLSFAVVLDDDLKAGLDDEPEVTSEAEVSLALSGDEGTPARKRRKLEDLDTNVKESRPSAPRTASPEQIEFVALIATLLRSPRIRLLAPKHSYLAGAVFRRLVRFFNLYAVETSAHLDAIIAVQAALDTVGLNVREEVINFGVDIWEHLLQLWATKNRTMKERVLMVLKTLFPYVVHAKTPRFDKAEGLSRLRRHLQSDQSSRWGFDDLRLDALRLEFSMTQDEQPFVSRTFRAGFDFDSSQEIAWANAELTADVTKELYIMSESSHSSASEDRRTRLENPIRSLLVSIQQPKGIRGKIYALQTLAFVVERHWTKLHAEMQLETINCLFQLINTDNADIQSWIFCCFAAIAFADSTISENTTDDITSRWDSVWSHSMRRTNAPIVCRAACHAAHALLLCSKVPMNRILTEIETMAQDINVQGPAAPYDSVCAFLGRCVTVAGRDARLYRMHFDDKVLSWLIENWNVLSGVSRSSSSTIHLRLEQHTVQDILRLLESACGFSETSRILCPIPLPQHGIVDLLQTQMNTSVIREFLLDACFPRNQARSRTDLVQASEAKAESYRGDLTQPDARARKVSVFFLKALESIISAWEESSETIRPPAESLRRTLDFAVLAICFESSLLMNGVANNRRSLLAACKLITLLTPHMVDLGWSTDELSTLVASFAPLFSEGLEEAPEDSWEAFIEPGKATGVRRPFASQAAKRQTTSPQGSARRLQRVIWRSSDVQDALDSVLHSFKRILKRFVTEAGKSLDKHLSPVVDDDRDGFGPIRTSNAPVAPVDRNMSDQHSIRSVVRMCVDCIALAPVLRSSEGHIAREKTLIDLVCNCDDVENFEIVMEPFLLHVGRFNIRLTPSNLDALLTCIEGPLTSYNYGSSDALHVVVIRLLHATTHIWLQNSFPIEIATKIRTVIDWLASNLKSESLCWWRTRDMLGRFWDHYLNLDPMQRFLTDPSVEEAPDVDHLPDGLIPYMTKDEDICVRLTAALSCARLFSTTYILSRDPMDVYTNIQEQLCLELDNYEHMLTRFLCLANILIASSAVRRGAYWHLLETCLSQDYVKSKDYVESQDYVKPQDYVKHVESVLRVAAEKLGMARFSELFEAYASQIAYSVRLSEKDFFCLPPHLLGYRNKEECAKATFAAFSPTNLLADLQEDFLNGQGPFAQHCRVLNQAPIDGLLRCFPDIIGYQIVFWIDDHQVPVLDGDSMVMDVDVSELFPRLQTSFASVMSANALRQQIAQNVDGIVCAILRTNGELDYGREGAIVKAFGDLNKPERSVRAFRALMQFRGPGEFEMHSPNLPCFSAPLILLALDWLCDQVESANSAATAYHVMQYFFALVARCPIINEQLRLLTSLCLWISLAYSHFKDMTLLRVLMSGSASLLAQPDLASVAQGMLDWAFIHLRETQRDSPHIVEILIRICSIIQELMSSDDEAVRKTGGKLKVWIEAQIVSLAEVESLRRCIAVSLVAWPTGLSDRLEAIRGNLGSDELSSILDDPYLSYHKFKIVRRLSELATFTSHESGRFAGHDFWRLKDSIPLSNMVPEEVDAFASLLIANSGHIRSQAVDQAYGRSIGMRQIRLSMQKNVFSVKRHVVQGLLDLLADQSARVVHIAYLTLRRLVGHEPMDSMEYGSWPIEYRGDIAFLSFCPVKEECFVKRELTSINESRFIEAGTNFTEWVSEMTTFLAGVLCAKDRFYGHLSDILADNVEFAAQMFPVLVHTLLLSDQRQPGVESDNGSRKILSGYLSRLLVHDKLDVRCHRSVITLILHLRHFNPGIDGDELAYNRWLDIDFMLLSRSAITCGAYTTALLFLELATEYGQTSGTGDESPERILFDIYSHIDEPDGFYGIKTDNLQDFLMRRFHHERQWDKAFQFHGAGFEAGSGDPRGSGGIVESLHSFGFNRLAMSTLQSMQSESALSRSTDIEYRLGWRTETWDLPDPADNGHSGATLYVALRAIHRERDPNVIDNVIMKSLTNELHRLRDLGNENLIEIRQVTMNLMCLAQIRKWRSVSIQNSLTASSISAHDDIWTEFCAIQSNFDFPDMENIMATRVSLLRSARQRDQREQIGSMQSDLTRALVQVEKKCLLRLSEAAREANQTQVALNSILYALQLVETSGFEVQQEFANVLWLMREQKFAVDSLKSVIHHRSQSTSTSDDDFIKVQDALALSRLGEWTSEACLEKPDFIHSQYFSPAIDLLTGGKTENLSSGNVQATVFHKCALFAEQQYQALITSDEIKRLQVYDERKSQEIAERKEALKRASTRKLQAELSGHQRKAEALHAQDIAQLKEFMSSRDNFLSQAVDMLSLCLQASDSFDIDAVIRLCSLWFANFKGEKSVVEAAIRSVPSRKFVFLAHQLSARLSASDISNSANQSVLQALLLRMCTEHPFHSLYQVYSLQSSHSEALSTNRRRSSNAVAEGSQADRAEAAFGIFERLQSAPESSTRARNVRILCNAYLEWAKYPIKQDPAIAERRNRKDKSDKLLIPKHLVIRKVKDLHVPVTTVNTPLDPSMRYENCIWIRGYQENFDVAGGVNLPKICFCFGSDGNKYKQLFKGEGNDDLRQDAVMEQVFELCNQVLSRDQNTRRRELNIRSYKVIPLASQAGLLEFVGNTRPLQFLVAAHERYNKADLTPRECHKRLAMRRDATERTFDGSALKVALVDEFTQIRQRFRPVMRHFFTEYRKDAQAWFEMRLKYSRSVAVTSIVGHILGLGDRHLSNILIDTVTGEVVHIDLGIAFEQGKLLPIPERVPFRLTADIVDGFGMSGTNGVFRRCAEETLRVLRDGSSVIKTVLEVFKYDPLHSWTMSAMKIRKAQAVTEASNQSDIDRLGTGLGIDLNSGVEDESADRALSSVAKKLDKSLSVEYTVNELIAEAMDITNLALMFVGWSPHC